MKSIASFVILPWVIGALFFVLDPEAATVGCLLQYSKHKIEAVQEDFVLQPGHVSAALDGTTSAEMEYRLACAAVKARIFPQRP